MVRKQISVDAQNFSTRDSSKDLHQLNETCSDERDVRIISENAVFW